MPTVLAVLKFFFMAFIVLGILVFAFARYMIGCDETGPICYAITQIVDAFVSPFAE